MINASVNLNENIFNLKDKGSAVFLYLVTIVAAVGGLLFGFDTGVISGANPFITGHFNLNAHQEGFVVSSLVIACIIGASFSGKLSDRLGRKKVLIFAAVLFTLSALLSAVPRTYMELIIARFIGGLAVGIASVISPMYIAEISPAKIRGALVALNQLTIVIGILFSYFSNWLLMDTGLNNWRFMFIAEAVPAGAFLFALFLIPESPRWLIQKGKTDDALAILTRIGGRRYAQEEKSEIEKTVAKKESPITELFKPGLRKVLLVGIIFSFFGQSTGIDTIIYYAPKIFLRAGYESASSAFLASVMVGVTLLIFTFIAILTVDRLGRKPLLLIGLAGMGISMAFTGLAFQSKMTEATWILIPIISYTAFFAPSMGTMIWVYISEIFPNNVRGRAMSITTMVLWISNFMTTQTFPWLVNKLEGASFYIYAVICAIAFVFMWLMVTETKGKSLEEIEKMWQ